MISLVSITVHNGRIRRTSRVLRNLSNLARRTLGRLGRLLARGNSLLWHTLGGLGKVSLCGVDVVGAGAVRVDLVRALGLDEGGDVLYGAGTAVVDGAVLFAGRVELDGWEALDLVGDVVEGGVDFGNGYFVGDAGEEVGELFVLGRQAAMVLVIFVCLSGRWDEG